MRYEDFEQSPAGRLVPTVFDARAFVPNPLPPEIDLGPLALVLGDARGAIGELRGACRRLRNPYILIRPLQRLEAQTSSAMEGTHTTTDELALAEAGLEKDLRTDAIEVANYTRALRWAESQMAALPIAGRLLKGAHERLLRGVGQGRGQDKRPGEYKRDQNMIGGTRIDNARFIPPPPKEAEDAMADLERYINREGRTPTQALLDLALVHYQFETIHPFADGNGRVGRMLISLMPVSDGLLDVPALYMSPELETRKPEYIDLMYNVSSKGAWLDWIGFFLEIATLSANRTVRTIDRVLALEADYRDRAMKASRSNNLLAVIDMAFDSPVVTAKSVEDHVGVTNPAARNLIRQLVELGVLTEIEGAYPTRWAARELIDLSRPDAI